MRRYFAFFLMVLLSNLVLADETITEGSKASSYDPDLITALFDRVEAREDGSLELILNLKDKASITSIVTGELTVRGGFVEIRQRNGVKGSFRNEGLDVSVATGDERILLKPLPGESLEVVTEDFLQAEGYSFHCDKEDEKCKLTLTLGEDWSLDIEGKASYVQKDDALSFIGTPEEFMFPEKVDLENWADLTSLPIDEKIIYLRGKPLKDSKIAGISFASEEDVVFRGLSYDTKDFAPSFPLLITLGKEYDVTGLEEDSPTIILRTAKLPKGSTRVRFFDNGNLLFSLEEGTIMYTEDNNVKSICKGCVVKEGGQLRVGAAVDKWFGTPRPTTLIVHPDAYPFFEKLVVLPFDDDKSRIIVLKEALPGAMVFSRSNLEITGKSSWLDFGISFITRLYRAKKGVFETLECRYPERKCYVDGVESASDFSAGHCATNEDCGEGRLCNDATCTSSPKCEDFIMNGPSETKFDLFFVGSGFTDDSTFEKTIRDLLLYRIGDDKGLFEYEPFAGMEKRFNVLKFRDSNPYPTKEKEEKYLLELTKLRAACPRSDLLIALINGPGFGAVYGFCMGFGGPCFIYTGLDGISTFDRHTFLHEFGHGFANLRDEYTIEYKGVPGKPGINCAVSRDQAELLWGKELADVAFINGWFGCGGPCDKHCDAYLRPSFNSIMKTPHLPDESGKIEYNSISKREILKILGGYA
ncbi:hypothetical protein HY501_03880 [Candidatus Woesearchaeota archaeon]|nr:hypothetical protein [Candidatus Woesearchaeota archaeon]